MTTQDDGRGWVNAGRIKMILQPPAIAGAGFRHDPGVLREFRAKCEPLFLGHPANWAAKLSVGEDEGIFLSNDGRRVLGWKTINDERGTALTADEILECQNKTTLGTDKDAVVKAWRKDLEDNPIGAFEFYRHTPPLSTMDILKLTPGNSHRQELVSLYGDIDGFTKYVQRNIDDKPEDVVRTFHVIRSELDAALMADFGGRRIRFVGDCIHGLLCEGTAQTFDEKDTVSSSTLCAGGLRSGFELSLEKHAA